jgi:rhodanese-related sulfurtransferase
MHKRSFLVLSASLILGTLLPSTTVRAADAEEFPLRKVFPLVKVIDIDELKNKLNEFTIVDVRSPFEYSIMHIQGAANIPLTDRDFIERAQKFRADTGKSLVFYCNGHHCAKSYEAASKASVVGKMTNTIAYDGGINDWAKANPELTLLLDKPLNPKAMISSDQFNAHLLEPKDFVSKVRADTSAKVVDLRDSFQTDGVSLLIMRETRTGFDIPSLKKVITEAKQANQAVFFYDAAGLQVKPLQYLIEDMGLTNYYFLKGGVDGYVAMLKEENKTTK